MSNVADHPHTDPGDGREECQTCGKWVWLVTHSCKGIPVTQAAMDRMTCDRCGAWFNKEGECVICPDVEYDLDQAHKLLDRVLMHWMYGEGRLARLQRDVEVWCRVAGPPPS